MTGSGSSGWKSPPGGHVRIAPQTCGLTTDGRLLCAVAGEAGWARELTVGEEVEARSIDLGHSHLCVLAASREAYCRGYNTYGQLGLGRPTHFLSTPHRMEMPTEPSSARANR